VWKNAVNVIALKRFFCFWTEHELIELIDHPDRKRAPQKDQRAAVELSWSAQQKMAVFLLLWSYSQSYHYK